MATAATETLDVEKPGTGLAHTQQNGMKGLAPANSITELLQTALTNGASVEQLEKLVGLYERVEAREAAKEFASAMAAFQAECPPVKHNKGADFTTNKGQSVKYTYAELDEIARKISPVLAKHGLSYTWDSTVAQTTLTCVCTVRHIAGHSASASFTLPTENSSVASPQQKIGMALTFAQRRSLSSVLGLTTTDEDTDAAQVDPTPINEDQVIHLDDLLRELSANRIGFLKYMGVESIDQIRAVHYKTALAAIEDLRAAKARRSGAST